MKRQSKKRLIAAAVASVPALFVTHAAVGQTWTGGSSQYWNDTGNWTGGTVPGTLGTAVFASTNSNPNVSLSNTTQAIGTILFDSTPTSFNLGVDAGDTFVIDAGGAITVNPDVSFSQTVSAAIQTLGDLTITENSSSSLTFGGNINMSVGGLLTIATTAGASTTQFNGNITDGGGTSVGSLNLVGGGTGASDNNNFIFNGNNTFSGTTSISVNTGSGGAIQIGSDSAFGTNKVTVTEPTGANGSQWEALGGMHTISNAMDLNSGLTFVGTNGLNFNGPINIISTNAGRTLNASVSGVVATFGSTSAASTITLGNPFANGGDGVGKTLTLNVTTGAMMVFNDALVDPSPGGGTASGTIAPAGFGTLRFANQSTYSGTTVFSANANTIIQIASSSMSGTSGIISGPFGVGTFEPNAGGTGNAYLQAVGADQTVANPVLFGSGGMTIFNAPLTGYNADPVGAIHSLTFSGPVSFGAAGRTISVDITGSNSLSFGLTGTNASTFTLPTGSNATTTLGVSAGASLILNDVIQDFSGSAVGTLAYTNAGTNNGGLVVLNAQNTYGDKTTFSSVAGSGVNWMVFQLPISSVMSVSGTSIVSGPFGTGSLTFSTNGNAPVILQPINTDQTIANPWTATSAGFFAQDAGTNLRSLTLSGAVTMGARTFTDNINAGSTENWGLPGSNASTITLNGQATLQSQHNPGSVLIINDLVQNSGTNKGTFLTQGLLNLTLANAANTFTGGVIINGGSIVNVNADGDLGAGTSTVTIGNAGAGGNLIGYGSFTSASRPISLNGNSIDLIDVTDTNVVTLNGLVSGTNGAGLFKGTNSGTLALGNPSNSYLGGTTINGGAVSVSSDGNLGDSGGAVNLNASASGELLSTGTFTSARTVNLNGSVNIIDVTGTNILTLTGSLGGGGDLTKDTNSGTLQLAQPGGYNLAHSVNVNGGTLAFGATSIYTSGPNGPVVNGGGLDGPVNIGGALTINAGTAAFNPSVPGSGQTHSIGSLSIGANSSLDIGNHTVIVQNAPDETVIGGYLANGYAGGYWNGVSTSGGSITSIVAYNDNSGATSVGYGNSADFTGTPSPYGVGGPKALSGNQVVVQPALAGDLVLTGSVGANELAYMLNSYGTTSYDGSDKNTWAFGNIDYNPTGLVESNDLALLLLNYGATSSGFVAPKTAAVSHSVKTVTTLTGTASPAVAADGIELDVYLATGDVQINGNNATDVSTLYLVSPGAGMIGGTTFTAAFDALFPDNAINSNTEINPYATPGSASAVNGMVDMGDIYNTSLNTMDLLFQFSEKNENRGGLVSSTVVYIGVPEPTTLSLMGLAAAGLLARRRRKNERN